MKSFLKQKPKSEMTKEDRQYLSGHHNFIIRLYFYLENGLAILNEFRNLFLGIAGIYLVMKVQNYTLIATITVASIIALVIIGYYKVHKLARMQEWLATRFSSHYTIRNFDYNRKQTDLLQEIRDLLKNQPK